jgi:hypothetical protein
MFALGQTRSHAVQQPRNQSVDDPSVLSVPKSFFDCPPLFMTATQYLPHANRVPLLSITKLMYTPKEYRRDLPGV